MPSKARSNKFAVRLEHTKFNQELEDTLLQHCPVRRLADFSETEKVDILLRLVHRMSPSEMLARGANPRGSRPWLYHGRRKKP